MVLRTDEVTRAGAADRGAGALGAVAAVARAVAEAPTADDALAAVASAVASATHAAVALVRLRDPSDGTLVARAVFAPQAALAAELEGSRIPPHELRELERDVIDERGELPDAVRAAAARAGAASVLLVPIRVQGRLAGTIEVFRAEAPFGRDERTAARVAADALAGAFRADGVAVADANGVRTHPLQLAAEAVGVAGHGGRTAEEVVHVAAAAAAARAVVLWRSDDDGDLRLAAAEHAPLDPSAWRTTALRSLAETRPVAVDPIGSDGGGALVTLLLGHPPLGALQLLLGRQPEPHELRGLGTFAVRAAQALRSAERAERLAVELERTRTLLEVVGQTNAQLSLAHALETALMQVAELLDVHRVAVYLLEDDGRLFGAAGVDVAGPHVRVAERLLELALGPFRGRGILVVEDARADPRLTSVGREAEDAALEAAVAAPLLAGDDVVGLLGVYPARGRALTENESALLGALAAQLAVSVQNARLHEDVARSDAARKRALESERQASRRVAALYEISQAFAQSLSLETTLDAVARTVVELLDVDAAVIRMPDERREHLLPRAVHVADIRLGEAIRPILLRPQPIEKLPQRRLLAAGRPLVLDAATAAQLQAHELLVPFLEKGSTAVVLPIATAAELLGTLTLLSLDAERPITPETTEIALSVARQSALAIDNARLYQQQKEFADTMQRSLLPRVYPVLRGLELGDAYQSSARVEVGGDVYDFVTLGDGRLAIVLGDVTGHGIDAAADMAMAKFVFRSLAREHPEPGEFLAAANEVVCGEIGAGKFITMLYLTVDPRNGGLVCADAGHEPPRLVLPDGSVEPLRVRGLALGVDRDQRYEEVRASLPAGASVVLYTDGLIEARRGTELYGHARLDRMLAEGRELPARSLARAVIDDCRAFAGGPLLDDCAIVVVKRTEE